MMRSWKEALVLDHLRAGRAVMWGGERQGWLVETRHWGWVGPGAGLELWIRRWFEVLSEKDWQTWTP